MSKKGSRRHLIDMIDWFYGVTTTIAETYDVIYIDGMEIVNVLKWKALSC